LQLIIDRQQALQIISFNSIEADFGPRLYSVIQVTMFAQKVLLPAFAVFGVVAGKSSIFQSLGRFPLSMAGHRAWIRSIGS
jgi:hypothetical protein